MSYQNREKLPAESVGLKLYRINQREELIGCEDVVFDNGYAAVDTMLRRAVLAGRVEVEGKIANHFADVLDSGGSMVSTVALDAQSYSSLKNHWMRCKVECD